MVKYLYYGLLFFLFVLCIYFLLSAVRDTSSVKIRFKRNRIKEIKEYTKEKLSNSEIDNIFFFSGVNITGYTYNLIRIMTSIGWLALIIFSYFSTKNISMFQMTLLILFFVSSSPRMTFAGFKTPFAFFTKLLTAEYRGKKNKEVYLAICQLRNIAAIKTDKLGSDYILEHLIKFTNYTKPIFSTMLKMWYEYDVDAACNYFAKAIDTPEGNKLAEVFKKLDYLSPSKLKEQLDLYHDTFLEDRQTAKEKQNEGRGFILYTVVTITAIFIFLNFIFIILMNNIGKMNNI